MEPTQQQPSLGACASQRGVELLFRPLFHLCLILLHHIQPDASRTLHRLRFFPLPRNAHLRCRDSILLLRGIAAAVRLWSAVRMATKCLLPSIPRSFLLLSVSTHSCLC
jgi:hypothetical protein